MDRCDIRNHSECSCEPGSCRVIHLGTFTKAPPVHPTLKDMAAMAAFISAVTFILAITFIPGAIERVNTYYARENV